MATEYEILQPVAQAMRAGKGKVLIGAGVSMQSGLSSWLELLRPVISEGLGIDLLWFPPESWRLSLKRLLSG